MNLHLCVSSLCVRTPLLIICSLQAHAPSVKHAHARHTQLTSPIRSLRCRGCASSSRRRRRRCRRAAFVGREVGLRTCVLERRLRTPTTRTMPLLPIRMFNASGIYITTTRDCKNTAYHSYCDRVAQCARCDSCHNDDDDNLRARQSTHRTPVLVIRTTTKTKHKQPIMILSAVRALCSRVQ
jgi:hypothetical protein